MEPPPKVNPFVPIPEQIIWETHNGMVICDIYDKLRKRIIDFMWEKFQIPDRFMSYLQLVRDDNTEDDFKRLMMHLLRNECSIMAIDTEQNEIRAVGILMWMTHEWRSWEMLPVILTSGGIADIHLIRRDIYKDYRRLNPQRNIDGLQVFEFYIDEDLKEDSEFMEKFFNSISNVASHMKMERVLAVALSMEKQGILEMAGYAEVHQIVYSMYVNKRERRPFHRMRDIDEMAVKMYEKSVEPVIKYTDLPGFENVVLRVDVPKERFRLSIDETE